MFFILSKYLWAIFQPANLLFILIIVGLTFYFFNKQKTATKIFIFSSIIITFISLFPISNWLISPLENRFYEVNLNTEIHGIIVLGGAEQVSLSDNELKMSFNGRIDRLFHFVDLGRKYPNAIMLFAGGNGGINKSKNTESDIAKRFFDFLNFESNRIIFEKKSRNTYENALFSMKLIKPKPSENWILITSAVSMPRAVGCFNNLQWNVIPYPVDFLLNKTAKNSYFNFNFANGLKNINKASFEWLGLLVYYLLDRTDTLFPGPKK